MQGKAKMNQYITIEKFIDILNEEFPQEHHVMVLAVLADISLHTDRFLINSSNWFRWPLSTHLLSRNCQRTGQAFISVQY